MALFQVAGQVEVIGEALDGVGPVVPGADVLQVAVGRVVASKKKQSRSDGRFRSKVVIPNLNDLDYI